MLGLSTTTMEALTRSFIKNRSYSLNFKQKVLELRWQHGSSLKEKRLPFSLFLIFPLSINGKSNTLPTANQGWCLKRKTGRQWNINLKKVNKKLNIITSNSWKPKRFPQNGKWFLKKVQRLDSAERGKNVKDSANNLWIKVRISSEKAIGLYRHA